MNSAPKVNFCGNPRPGLQLKPVQHSFLCTASNKIVKCAADHFIFYFEFTGYKGLKYNNV